MRIIARMTDGATHEADGSLMLCLADRIAFRNQFRMTFRAFLERNNRLDGDEPPEDWDERWPAFFQWRCLARNGLGLDFEAFCEQVAGIRNVSGPGEEEDVDPTAPTPTTPSSPPLSSSPASAPPT